jgi:NADPH:quinone reductase-like Zn-dependent oxidoreductase
LFRLLETGQIKPVIEDTFPICEAAKANQILESGSVVGNLVLLAPELLEPSFVTSKRQTE